MSANSQSFEKVSRNPDVLNELLHWLSQPLTSLLCSLELSLSIEDAAEQQQSVSVALQQTERVIGMTQLMREYLDTEPAEPAGRTVPLAPIVRNVCEQMVSIAAVRDIKLRLVGTCTASLAVPETRLRLALQYLIAGILETQANGTRIMLLLGEGPAGSVLRAEGEAGSRVSNLMNQAASPLPGKSNSASVAGVLRRARLAIAARVLEGAGASLVFNERPVNEFVLRIPRKGDCFASVFDQRALC
jgi:hypothetical protein